MCLHCKANGVFDAQKAIKQAIEDYHRHTSEVKVLEDISPAFIERLAKDSYTAKSELRNLFSKSPNWNENLQCIVLDGIRDQKPNYDLLKKWIYEIISPLEEKLDTEKYSKVRCAAMFFYISNSENKYLVPTCIDALNEIAPKAYRANRKMTRIFKSFCDALGVTDNSKGSNFQKLFARITDELSPKKENFKLYVSINPAHFLTMSNPKFDNRGSTMVSCHSLNCTDYPYNNGCTGYARDNYSFIVFTASDDNKLETLNNRKTSRQIFAYKPYNGVLLQSRMYTTNSGSDYGGVDGDTAEGKIYRDLIQRELSALENVQSIWDTCNYYDNKFDIEISKGKGFGGYADWLEYRDCAKISIRTDKFYPLGDFSVGAKGLCIECGKEISNGLYCGGKRCTRDAVYYKCCECGEDFCSDEIYEVRNCNGETVYICADCLRSSEIYYECADCGEIHCIDDMTIIADNCAVCQSCLENNYGYCEICGEWERLDDMVWVENEDNYFCESCLEQSDEYECCECCGRWYRVDDMILNGYEHYICEDCLDREYSCCDCCGEYYEEEFVTTPAVDSEGNEIYICENCSRYSYGEVCEDCGRHFHIGHNHEENLCPACRNSEEGEIA